MSSARLILFITHSLYMIGEFMPRTKRIFSPSGYMHLILRGVGKQIIFEDSADRRYFIKLLKHYSAENETTILAYCLMDNHVHLLIHNTVGKTSFMMRRLETSYAVYFNQKYERTGHLFQNRYLNENIENTGQLLRVFRYILNNPAKAGICSPFSYEWSSYHLYENDASFVDVSPIKKEIGSLSNLRAFLNESNTDEFREAEIRLRNDEWAKKVLRETLQTENGYCLQNLNRAERNKALHKLKAAGLTLRQIERLTGISKSVIQRV